jgi:hypothetical protein
MRRTGSNILAPGLRPEGFRTHLFPAFTADKELQATRLPLQRLARGKSYPVTAAQLLRLHTGFLAPIHCFKLAKNCASNSGLRFRVQDLFSQARFPRPFLQCQQLTQN